MNKPIVIKNNLGVAQRILLSDNSEIIIGDSGEIKLMTVGYSVELDITLSDLLSAISPYLEFTSI